jgi:Flp pilus assembly protein TadG
MWKTLRSPHWLLAFWQERRGAVAATFGLAVVPIMLALGAAVDYERAALTRSRLQQALDSAVLAGASQLPSQSVTVATNVFNSDAPTAGSPALSVAFQSSATSFSGAATATLPTAFLGIAGINAVTVSASAAARFSTTVMVNPCIVTLGTNLTVSTSSFTLNGAPNWNMTGCNIVSNTSMNCNGHGGGASASAAVGTVSSCTNPVPHASAWVDSYGSYASKITTKCTSNGNGVSWIAGGSLPTDPDFLTISQSEYHVCGDLNLSGAGTLPSALIVIENGSLNMANNANVTATNTTFVLTGDNQHNHYITFPNGQGQGATLTVDAPTDSSNPWAGIAVFIDPALTQNVNNTWGIEWEDDTWGPGASFFFDGVAYMPYTDLTIHGNTQSGANKCSLLVTHSFVADGTATITYYQSPGACSKAAVQALVPASLVK